MRSALQTICAAFLFSPFTIFSFGAFSLPEEARAQDTGVAAQQAVKGVIDELKTVVATEKDRLSAEVIDKKLHDILAPVFDFEELSRGCLGATWGKATAEEKQKFVELFTDLLSRTYLSKIRRNIEGAIVEFLPSVVKDERVVVKTKIKNPDGELSADYRLHLKNAKWQVYDIIIENVGLVTNYRSEFAGIVRKEGMSGLLGKLQTRVSSLGTEAK